MLELGKGGLLDDIGSFQPWSVPMHLSFLVNEKNRGREGGGKVREKWLRDHLSRGESRRCISSFQSMVSSQ